MPYLNAKRKDELLANHDPENAGDLTYLFTADLIACHHPLDLKEAVWLSIGRYLTPIEDPRFENFAVVLGALAAAKLEYSRRNPNGPNLYRKSFAMAEIIREFYKEKVAPYEDQKIKENGDVY